MSMTTELPGTLQNEPEKFSHALQNLKTEGITLQVLSKDDERNASFEIGSDGQRTLTVHENNLWEILEERHHLKQTEAAQEMGYSIAPLDPVVRLAAEVDIIRKIQGILQRKEEKVRDTVLDDLVQTGGTRQFTSIDDYWDHPLMRDIVADKESERTRINLYAPELQENLKRLSRTELERYRPLFEHRLFRGAYEYFSDALEALADEKMEI